MYDFISNVFNHSADFWVALGTVGLFFATLLLVWVGRRQILAMRDENAKWKTMEACERYDSDPVMHACLEQLFMFHQGKSHNQDPRSLRVYVATVLNYFDGIAIGVAQGLYNKDIVKDHLEFILKRHVKTYLETPEEAKKYGVNHDHYAHLHALHSEWSKPKTTYRKKIFTFRDKD